MTSLSQISTIMREKSLQKPNLESKGEHTVQPSGLYEVRAIRLPGGSWRHYYVDHSSKTTYWILPYSHPNSVPSQSCEPILDYLPSYEECVSETSSAVQVAKVPSDNED